MAATLVYDTSRATIWHGRAQDVLPGLQRDSVDLLATDPPYGQKWQSGRRINRLPGIEGDDVGADDLVQNVVIAAAPAIREHRHLYIFGRPDLTGLPIGGTTELVWDKAMLGSGDLTSPWGPSWEPITFAVYVSRASGRARGDGRLAARLRHQSVIRVPRPNAGALEDGKNPHPTRKPVELMRRLIESSSCIGETVLDPFAGSGSTLVAAVLSGRRAVGIECDDRYIPTICDRLHDAEQIADRIEAA